MLFLTILLSLLLHNESQAHKHTAYSHSVDDPRAHHPKWMEGLSDATRLDSLNIPGTHDSGALYGPTDIPGPVHLSTVAQVLSIGQQLDSGIRFLDIRLRHLLNKLWIHHGPIYQRQSFGDVLSTVASFLGNNSGEAVLIRVKEEYKGLTDFSDRSFEDTFKDYMKQYKNVIWKPANDNPKLGEIRGKIVFLKEFASKSKFGIKYPGNFEIQDAYKVPTPSALYAKWIKVKKHFFDANKSHKSGHGKHKKAYINYLSGSSYSFPFFVASGHSSPETDSDRAPTGIKTIHPDKDTYPDFPREKCISGVCEIVYEGINILSYELLKNSSNKIGYAGIVLADFPGKSLIDIVIQLNNPKNSQENYASNFSCKSEYTEFNDNCYKAISSQDKALTHIEAEATCVSENGHLASIHSQSEQDFVAELVLAESKVHGDLLGRSYFWLGMIIKWTEPSEATWTDGSAVDFAQPEKGKGTTPWEGTQVGKAPAPSNYYEEEKTCAIIQGNEGRQAVDWAKTWTDVPCDNVKSDSAYYVHNFVCKNKKVK